MTFDTLPRPPRRPRRRPTRYEAWAWEVVQVLRVALIASYILAIALAVIGGFAGLPVFRDTQSSWATAPWALLLGGSALVGAVAAVRDGWKNIEGWASLGVIVGACAYVIPIYLLGFAANDINRQAVAIGLTHMLVLPVSRFVVFAFGAGRLPAER